MSQRKPASPRSRAVRSGVTSNYPAFDDTGVATNGNPTGAAPPPQGTFVDSTPHPEVGAKAAYDQAILNATNPANATYGSTVDQSIAGEGAFGLDVGATLDQRDPSWDPSVATTGHFDWNNIEASNPFSKAAALVRSYHQQQNRSLNGLAARGQLHSGAMGHQQGLDTLGYQGGQDTLDKALLGYLTGQSQARKAAAATRDSTIANAGLTALGSLLGQ